MSAKLTKKQRERRERLLPGGKPRYVRCYESRDDCPDKYTVVFTKLQGQGCHYVGMSAEPFHPQGIGQHGWHDVMIDQPSHKHLGRRISFDDLPPNCQKLVLQDYVEFWNLGEIDERDRTPDGVFVAEAS